MMLHLLSNVNMDLIAPMLHPGFEKIELKGYNRIVQPLMEMKTDDSITDDTVWIHIDGPEISQSNPQKHLDFFLEVLDAAESLCHRKSSVNVIVSNLAPSTYSVCTQQKDFYSRVQSHLANVRMRLISLSNSNTGFHIFDFEKLVQEYGRKSLDDPRYWYLGRIRYSLFGFETLSQEFHRLHNAITGNAKKVLIVDLDNTLWQGVLGEEGPNGITLSEDGIGKAYRDFQQLISATKENGVMLAICSKNNIEDVKDVFIKNSMMVLAWDDFVDHRINWLPKAKNLEEMASTLNLAPDSFVFIDDSQVERDSVRKLLPDITVPEMPDDPANIPSWFVKEVVNQYFNRTSVTAEDNNKSDQYRRQQQRETHRKAMSLDDYLHSLHIRHTIHRNPENQIQRIAQLTQKTNQFNVTTKRYSDSDIRGFIESESTEVFTLEYEDKFGKEGIVGVIIAVTQEDTATIDTFLLSCRVIGRQVEHRFLRDVAATLKLQGITTIIGEYVETPKNVPVKNLYPELGFTGFDNGYSASPANLINHINHILTQGENAHGQ